MVHWTRMAQCSINATENNAEFPVLQMHQAQCRDWGKRGRLCSLPGRGSVDHLHPRLTRTRGKATGRVDGLGKEGLEMLGEASEGPCWALKLGRKRLRQLVWRAAFCPLLSFCPPTPHSATAGLPQPGLLERSTNRLHGPGPRTLRGE